MNQNEFEAKRKEAALKMLEMNSKRKEEPPLKQKEQPPFEIPFLNGILKDGDSSLIIGLLLILMSEKADKLLLFALIYILM